jgi:hypothetical protein
MSSDFVAAAVVAASVSAICAVEILRGIWDSRETVRKAKEDARIWHNAADAAERRELNLRAILDAHDRRLAAAWNYGDPVARCAEAIRLVEAARNWTPMMLDCLRLWKEPPAEAIRTDYREGDATFADWNVSTWLREADRVVKAGPGPYPRTGLDDGAQREEART